MKHLVVPALSALLLAGLAAQADPSAPQMFQLARNDHGGGHPAPGAAQPSPATVPAGAIDNPANGNGHGRGQHGGATGGSHGATTGGATTTGGRHGAGGATTGGLFTGTPTATGRTHGTHPTGGGTNGHATTGGTAGGLFTGTPAGHGMGGATNAGGHAGTFGRRPPNWNRFPRTFDRGTYQRNITAPRHYHWQTYNRPHGWYYRRWTYGQLLPSIFWANDYWLNDYWMFDLPIPPYGYVWVRYGDDALLVNTRTGEVLQVVYGLFD